jgi:dGTPase
MVKDIIQNTNKNLSKNKIKTIKDVFNSKSTIVCFSEKMRLFDISIKNFLKEKMYFSPSVVKKTNKGKKIIKKLFIKILQKPNKFIKLNNFKNKKKERAVCDFIAGMTDRFAINLYNKIK